jgi:predicted Zn-dependent protease with MMP-like domain
MLGQDEAARAAWLRTFEIDQQSKPPPRLVDDDQLEAMTRDAVASLPAELRGRLANLTIAIQPGPTRELVDAGLDPRSPGYLDDGDEHLVLHLFRHNLERSVTALDVLTGELLVTVVNECAELFDISDQELADLGLL